MRAMNPLYSIKVKEIWAYLKTQDHLFWLINIYLFFEYVRPQTLYPAINIIPYPQVILFITMVLFLLRPDPVYTKNFMNRLFILFFIVVVVSSIMALSPETAYEELPLIFSWLVIYFLIINIINTEERLLVFVLAFLIYSFKMAQFSFRNWLRAGFDFMGSGSGGGPGWFHNSGEFGIQMVVFLAVSACFVFALKSYWPRWKQGLICLFPLTALSGTVSSSSRGAVLGAAAVALYFILKSKYRVKSLLVLVAVGFAVYSFIPDQQMARFSSIGKDSTSMSRFVLWEHGLDLIDRYPVLGVGYKNWVLANEQILGIENIQVPHNIFIECAAELGYLGLAVFILMILYTFILNSRTRKMLAQSKEDFRFLYFLAYGLDGALVGFMVSGFFVTVLYYPYFWINLAMTVSLHESARTALGLNEGKKVRKNRTGEKVPHPPLS